MMFANKAEKSFNQYMLLMEVNDPEATVIFLSNCFSLWFLFFHPNSSLTVFCYFFSSHTSHIAALRHLCWFAWWMDLVQLEPQQDLTK